MNNFYKKAYFKPELMVITIDQEITLVMFTRQPPDDEFLSAPESGTSQTSEVFGDQTQSLSGDTPWVKE